MSSLGYSIGGLNTKVASQTNKDHHIHLIHNQIDHPLQWKHHQCSPSRSFLNNNDDFNRLLHHKYFSYYYLDLMWKFSTYHYSKTKTCRHFSTYRVGKYSQETCEKYRATRGRHRGSLKKVPIFIESTLQPLG